MARSSAVRGTGASSKRNTRLTVIVVVGVVMVGIAILYKDPIRLFVRLRAWDRQSPGQAVTAFLSAGKQKNISEANRYVDTATYEPMVDGSGYFVVTPSGTMDFRFKDIVPDGEVKVASVDFILTGDGAAEVQVPQKSGQVASYRLKMVSGEWKITEIRGGGQ